MVYMPKLQPRPEGYFFFAFKITHFWRKLNVNRKKALWDEFGPKWYLAISQTYMELTTKHGAKYGRTRAMYNTVISGLYKARVLPCLAP